MLVEALHRAENIEDVFEREDALRYLPTTTELLVETLIAMPSPEEILTAPAELASQPRRAATYTPVVGAQCVGGRGRLGRVTLRLELGDVE